MTTIGFAKFRQEHDPDAREDYTFEFRLNDDEAIATATVDVVDSSSESVDGDTDLVLASTAFGRISGTLYGVTVWVSGGGSASQYYLRCRGETDSSPFSRKFDRTMILGCRQL